MSYQTVILIIILVLPFILTSINIYSFYKLTVKNKEIKYSKAFEIISIIIAIFYLLIYLNIVEVKFVDYYVQLYNNERHFMISLSKIPTIITLMTISFGGYCYLRVKDVVKMPPLSASIALSNLYIGLIILILWTIQVYPDLFMSLVSINIMLIYLKVIIKVNRDYNKLIQNKVINVKYEKLSNILNKANSLSLLGLLLLIPMLTIILMILLLFGQRPSDIITAWTNTADWTFSSEVAPQNIYFDQHYLCSVAAGGHNKVVKPLREGKRGNNKVLVNRQLCVANAFEQIIEERIPKVHRVIRKFYDTYGYPIANHINSKLVADIIYILMKPLEYIFLIIIYMFEAHPEDLIAVQYPHKKF